MTYNPTSTFDAIIYRPGGVSAGDVVATWAEVKTFIQASSNGKCIVYIDDSLAAAHVPAASGVTDGKSRVELCAYRQNDVAPTTLTVDNGATLKAILKVSGTLQIFCPTAGATPALDFDYSGGAEPVLFLEDGGSVAATGPNPSCVIPAAGKLSIGLQESASVFATGGAPLFSVPVGTQLDFFATNSIIGDGVAAGAGTVFLFYDTATVTLGGGNTPVFAGLTGTYGAELLDPNAIIYKPGSTSFGRTVATWAEVQPFISNLQGTGTVYVDDSIVSPALVPAATGVTNCQGRVTIEPFLADAVRFTTLQIEPGATLQDLAKVNAMELRCNPQNATRSLTFTSTNGGYLFISDGGMISNAATATQPAIDAPAGMFTTLDLTGLSLMILNAPAVPLVAVAAGGELNLFAFDASAIPAGYASGPVGGTVALLYDNGSANAFPTPGTPPALPGFAGTYISDNRDDVWAQKQIDPASFNAPALNAVPVFDGTKWQATTAPASIFGGSIIYRPGTPSAGDHVATWPEVQTFVTTTDGKCIVYVDDSITSPAPVPGATGITDCQGRVTIKAAFPDSLNTPVLEIEAGATLRNLSFVVGVEVQSNATTATPSLDYTTPNGGNLSISEFGALSNAGTATQPAVVVPAGQTFFLHLDTGDLILNAPAVPLFSLAATSTLTPYLFNASVMPANYASGAGDVFLNYDNASAKFFAVADVPSPLPGLTGTYKTVNLDAVLPNPGPQAQATWFIDPQNVTGLADDNNSGIDAAHPVLTYNFGVARKWTTYSPMLRQDTTLTWLSSQPVGAADPVTISPIMVGSVLTLQGGLGPAQLVHSGVLAGVISKNRATGQLLAANLGFAVARDMLVKNTTVGKESFAWVYTPGVSSELTQPLNPATMPFDFSTVVSEVDTWANGDTFEIYQPLAIDLVSATPTSVMQNAGFADAVQIYHLIGFSVDGTSGDSNFIMGLNVTLVESAFDSVVEYPFPSDDEGAFVSNCFLGAAVECNPIGYSVQVYGGAIVSAPFASTALSWSLALDTIIDNPPGGSATIIGLNAATVLLVGDVYIKGTIHAGGGQFFRGILWGPGTLDGIGTTRIGYNAPAVTRFQNAALTLNTQANANAFDPTTGLWSILIPITAANLDLAFGAGGFGGLATNVGGASFSGQGTP